MFLSLYKYIFWQTWRAFRFLTYVLALLFLLLLFQCRQLIYLQCSYNDELDVSLFNFLICSHYVLVLLIEYETIHKMRRNKICILFKFFVEIWVGCCLILHEYFYHYLFYFFLFDIRLGVSNAVIVFFVICFLWIIFAVKWQNHKDEFIKENELNLIA